MDSNKFIEIKKPIEEVREVEEVKLETPLVEKTEASFENSEYPDEISDEDKRNKNNTEEVIGGGLTATSAANPVFGGVATGATGALGGVVGLVGEATDNDSLKMVGDTYKESAKKPAKNVGRVIKKIFD